MLLEESCTDILSLHRSLASRSFTIGRYDHAQVHLRCLDLCRTGYEALVTTLHKYGLPCELRLNETRLRRVTHMASDLIDDWCTTLVHDAEKITEDAEAINHLPKGIRKKLRGGH